MVDNYAELLRSAIARNAAAVVSLPSGGILRHCRARFLSEEMYDGGPGIWVESDRNERLLIDILIQAQKAAAISFKNGPTKIVFLSPIVAQDVKHAINPETAAPAMLLKWPSEIKAIQRRNNYRVQIAASHAVTARIWRISRQACLSDRPLNAQELVLELRDLSIGGLGVNFLPKNNEPVKVSPADRLRIQLTLRGTPLLLEGRLRFPKQVPREVRPVRAGIQFDALEFDLQVRQKLAALTRAVGEMQREEVRHYRMGAAG